MVPTSAAGSLPSTLPLVGRREEIRLLFSHLRTGGPGEAAALVLHGPGGVGKTRLVEVTIGEARRKEWTVLAGRGFPAEAGVPYATFSAALAPLLREMPPDRLSVLARGAEAELAVLFPAFGSTPGAGHSVGVEPQELKVRLFWTFTEFLGRLSARGPILLVFEDLQWADPSSLELLHFALRNLPPGAVRALGTYADEYVEEGSRVQETVASLVSHGLARRMPIPPFSLGESRAFVSRTFDLPEEALGAFPERLHDWTGGNAFFVTETLRSLVESGKLRKHEGTWFGWETTSWEIPGSVRDVVSGRIARCSPLAREVASLVAVGGEGLPFDLLASLTKAPELEAMHAVDELIGRGILGEGESDGAVVLRFGHPLVRETVYGQLSRAHARVQHRDIAAALERRAGRDPLRVCEDLAYHYVRAGGESEPRAVLYLVTAGKRALDRQADEEAVAYLEKAMALHDRLPAEAPGTPRATILDALGRALQRQGRYTESFGRWQELLKEAEVDGNADRSGDTKRRMALDCFWSGRHRESLDLFEEVLASSGSPALKARVRLGYGMCLQEIAEWDRARGEVARALEEAEAVDDVRLRAAAHRALALLHTWRGPPEEVRVHGTRAIELAQLAGDRNVLFWGHWALAVHEGLTGNLQRMDRHIEESRRIAEELRSPVLRLWTDEIGIERAYVTGEWDVGIAMGERAVALARSLQQGTLLPRLLVWTAILHLGRDDLERGRAMVLEAWAGAASAGVHATIPAYIGMVGLRLAEGDYREAARVGEEGLVIASRSGYALWEVHRLLPLVGEAYILLRALDDARRISARVRQISDGMGHALGLAWADACDALVIWLDGDVERGAAELEKAVARLEAIPVVPEAARVRRQLAGRLAELGEREHALQELRKAHEVFSRLGLVREIDKARGQFREMESRAPSRSAGPGAGDLTGREVAVARLVAERKSNKAIAKALGMSPRTVGTHLSNIYKKLEIGTREELSDLVRERRVLLE